MRKNGHFWRSYAKESRLSLGRGNTVKSACLPAAGLSEGTPGDMASGQPPLTRARAGSSRALEAGEVETAGVSLDSLVEAVAARLVESG